MPEDIEALSVLLAAGTGLLLFFGAILIAALVFYLIGLCKIFKKAGKPGWAAIIPVYKSWVLVEVANLNWWWFLLVVASTIVSLLGLDSLSNIATFIGAVGLFACYYNIAKRFGKGAGFAFLMLLFPVICLPILGMGKNNIYDSSIPVSKNAFLGKPEASNFQPTNNNNVNVAPVMSVQPEVAPVVAPVVAPEVAPVAAPEVAPEVAPVAAPVAAPEVAPEVLPFVKEDTSLIADNTNVQPSTDTEFIFCAGCGTKVVKGTAFCPNCGKNIAN